MHRIFLAILCTLALLMAASSCRVARYAGEGGAVVSHVEIRLDGEPTQDQSFMMALQQRPYHRTFGFLPISAWIWQPDTTTYWRRLRHRLGSEPAVFDSSMTDRTAQAMALVMKQRGFLEAKGRYEVTVNKGKARVVYHLTSGMPRRLSAVHYLCIDPDLQQILTADSAASLLHVGQQLDRQLLESERQRITAMLREQGYWDFDKEHITYLADTLAGSHDVELTCMLQGIHTPWHIREVHWPQDHSYLRQSVLDRSSFIQPGMLYSERAIRNTTAALSRLPILRYVNVRVEPVADGEYELDCYIDITPQSTQSVLLEIEGTNTAGDFGAAFGTTYQHRNAFSGSEAFTASIKGSYEALSGNVDRLVNDSYQEYAAQFGLDIPRFVFPFISDDVRRRSRASTMIKASFSMQRRPEYNRNVAKGSIAYRWNSPYGTSRHLLDVVNLSYVHLPEQSETFHELIQHMGPIVYSSYTSHFILSTDYMLAMGNNNRTTGREQQTTRDLWSFRMTPEIAGNLLSGICSMANVHKRGQEAEIRRYEILGQPFEQYARFDVDWSYSHYLTHRSRLALHAAGGVAVPYGNSNVMPFEKRYYSGGANSVRGWSVRELGPGTYASGDWRYNYFNQCGDIRLDASIELRTRLFWKLESALFLDAGNVWTIKDYESQQGGAFTDEFYKQIATAWGTGVRLITDLVILRLDWGFKIYDPSSGADESFALLHPFRGSHNTVHFAVGYPF